MGGLVSVIIPTYQRADKLKRALDSVNAQTYRNIEIIVVDDNNPENSYRKKTELFMKKYVSALPLKYVKMLANAGGAMARNSGIKEASGAYITFLDDDDEYLPEKIEKQVEKFEQSPSEKTGMVYCQINFMDSGGRFRKMRAPMHASGNKIALEKHLVRNLAPTSGLMIKKEVLEDVGGFRDLLTGHEYELIMRILAAGYDVDYNEEPLVNMYYHMGKRITTGSRKIMGEKILFHLKKKTFPPDRYPLMKKVAYAHYMDLCRRYYFQKNTRAACLYFRKASRHDPLKIKTVIGYLGIFLDSLKRRSFLEKK
ncbi:MAG TPA: glycosyltransferase family 2 protein [Firmicutes bacterium]|nr:glycosyltransferase family 2 protein [Bacillota bacterium]